MRTARSGAVVWLALAGCGPAAPDVTRGALDPPADRRDAPTTCEATIDLGSDGTIDERSLLRQAPDGRPLDLTHTDASGAVTDVKTWGYDTLGRPTQWTHRVVVPGGYATDVSASISYTTEGSTERKTTYDDPSSGLETWRWDPEGRLLSYRVEPLNPGPTGSWILWDYRFDTLGRLVYYVEESGPANASWAYGWRGASFVLDDDGRVLEREQLHDVLQGQWVYGWSGDRLVGDDFQGFVGIGTTKWTWDHGDVVRADVDWDDDGDVDDVIDYTVDAQGHVVLATHSSGYAIRLAWDEHDRVVERVEGANLDPPTRTDRFDWDNADRIVRYELVEGNTRDVVETWTYAPGRPTASHPEHGDVTSFQQVEDGVVTLRYTYDGDGNLLTQYEDDWRVTSPVDVTYAYTGACACQRGVFPMVSPIGPAPSRPCAADEDTPARWRLPERPEPENAGGGPFEVEGSPFSQLYPEP